MKLTAREKKLAALMSNRSRLSAIWMIYSREMRDQLRDRRTLFTIAILPILLYPLVGMLLLQIVQFTQQHSTTVCLVGKEHLVGAPPLVVDGQFVDSLTESPERRRVSSVSSRTPSSSSTTRIVP